MRLALIYACSIKDGSVSNVAITNLYASTRKNDVLTIILSELVLARTPSSG